MRAGEDDQARPAIGDSENLDLLAAHNVGKSSIVHATQARGDVDNAAADLDGREIGADFRRARRTLDVRRLDPAIPAPDHARSDNRQFGMGRHPAADQRRKR